MPANQLQRKITKLKQLSGTPVTAFVKLFLIGAAEGKHSWQLQEQLQ